LKKERERRKKEEEGKEKKRKEDGERRKEEGEGRKEEEEGGKVEGGGRRGKEEEEGGKGKEEEGGGEGGGGGKEGEEEEEGGVGRGRGKELILKMAIYLNEIEKRFLFLEKLKEINFEIFNIYFKENYFKVLKENWEKIKNKNLKVEEKEELNNLLIKLLKINKINKEKLFLNKICEFFIEKNNFNFGENERKFIQKIFNLNNKEEIEEFFEIKIERGIENIKQINEQINLGWGVFLNLNILNKNCLNKFNVNCQVVNVRII